MQIEVRLDSACTEPKIIVVAGEMTEELNALLKRLTQEAPQLLAGFRDNTLEILEQPSIIRVYAAGGKVFAVTEKGEYTLRLRLYELEERLDRGSFVRISHSEIINLRKAKGFDLSLAGTICVSLSNGTAAYVSRRYVAKIKQVLGL